MNQRQRDEQKKKVVSARRRLDEHESAGGGRIIKAPEGALWYKIKAKGSYEIDVIPFTVGKGNPYADEGELHYERTYFAHRNIGVNNERVICAAKTYNEPCYVCEYRAEAGKDPDNKDLVKALFPSERQLWNVLPHDGENAGKLCLWDQSYFLFGGNLDERLKRDREDKYTCFADPEEGWTLVLGSKETKLGTGVCYTLTVDEFKKRKKPIPDSVLEKAYCLDDLLIKPKYADVKRMMHAAAPDEEEDGNGHSHEEEEERPSRSKARVEEEPPRSKKKEEEEEDAPKYKKGDLVLYKGMECKVLKINKDGTLELLNEEKEEETEVSPKKVRPLAVDDSEDEEKTEAKPSKNGHAKAEEEDDDEVADDDEPVVNKAKKKTK